MSKKRIVFDFDGVIHKYSKGWSDGSIYDEPVEGIKEVIDNLRLEDNYEVVIVSTRSKTIEGKTAIKKWLERYNIIVDSIATEKPPAMVYIDDRALCFDGDSSTLREKISNFKTWQGK